ncbi:type II secretion system protein J [Xylella taiwanensis]|uniref:Type II secretion system protein J n=2 Tax=Xylella taiwanensis TaxID=1444770 RepID=A0ABS8TQU0_9GAMM|nr:type II secretion system protein J [Xylella taiwanensis]MCD8456955.1 type II secretion system protein J [Xylella taiwanensis]MCD8459366.1 type II secretion system protein J [Xylella taiwanensis]MCD8461763.1 type II secretion system protein J [Xylella taiwanensis]MCD8462204.1 type II secretion system protein J [Xylella taiwanensis]MCD8465991.1 type II secretion system protein J [Xylella taiwanensis]
MRRMRGFSLIEVLLATVLLASGLTLAFVTLHSVSIVSRRNEALASRNERMRAVELFLRRRLMSALPLAMAEDKERQVPLLFMGEAQRMRFVADVPDYLGRGGPYLHDINVAESGAQRQLRIALTMLQPAKTVQDDVSLPPELLVDGLHEVHFRYRGWDQERHQLGPWLSTWPSPDQLPVLVAVQIKDDIALWPTLVVALMQSGAEGVN